MSTPNESNETLDPNMNNVTMTTKIYPTTYRNRKGFKIGNMKIGFDTFNKPFTSMDEVDHYLNELFKYIKWTRTDTVSNDDKLNKTRKNIRSFLKAKKIQQVFAPLYEPPSTDSVRVGGGKSKGTRKRKYKLNKTRRKKDKDKK